MKFLQQEDHPLTRNSSTGNASQKALLAGGNDPFSNEDKFIREVLQNSCDAAISNEQDTYVVFRACRLHEAHEQAWNRELSISDHLAARISSAVPDFPEDNRVGTVLFIEDYSTHGLSCEYNEFESESKFYRFFFGSGDNEDQGGSGGSFGYGKAVYTDNSRIRTIVAYSCTIENGQSEKRLFGITRTKKYDYLGKMYSGYIYHGRLVAAEEGTESQPICGDEADQLADKLGFKVREADETGTSIAVLGLDRDPDSFLLEIKKSTEVFWWKKLADRQLTVEFIDSSGNSSMACPRDNPMLEPFLASYETCTGRREKPNSDKATYQEHNLNSGMGIRYSPGKVALVELKKGTEAAPDTHSLLVNSIALFRSSGMVVEYRKPGGTSDSGKYVAGIFMANDKLNELLRSSEPASHWGWNENSARIAELKAFKDLEIDLQTSKRLIKSIKDRIDRRFNDFRDKLGEAAQVSQASFRSLDKLMSELLGTGKSPGLGGSSARGVSIINKSASIVPGSNSPLEQYDCEVFISIEEGAPDASRDLIIKHYMEIKGDDAANSTIDRLQSKVLETDAIIKHDDSSGSDHIYTIDKEGARFMFRTAAVSPRFHRETETVVRGVV
jgi:hypothetical protein